MARRKPVREMDAILIRVPDGMKDRLLQRATAHGRSMNSEIVSMLTDIMGEPNEMELRELEAERALLLQREKEARAQLDEVQSRLLAITQELADRVFERRTKK